MDVGCYEYKQAMGRCQSKLGRWLDLCYNFERMAEGETGELEIGERAEILKRIPLFADLGEPDRRRLAASCASATYKPNDELYHQSDTTEKMFILRSGQIALYNVDPQGQESLVGYRTGWAQFDPESEMPFTGWLGEGSVLLRDPHDVSVVAMSPVATLEVTHATLRDKELGVWRRLTPEKHENAERAKYLSLKLKWLDKDEIIMKHVNQHSWALARQMLIPVGVLLVLAFILLSSLIAGLSIVILLVLMLIPLAVGAVAFIDWRDDYYVVTNKRVLHLDEVPWGRQKREESPLANIQEIQVSRLSLAAQLLDFGDLRVETFGGSVAMQYVPNPDSLRTMIFNEKTRVLSRGRASARKSIHRDLVNRIGQADKSMPKPVPRSDKPPKSTAYRPGALLRSLFKYLFPPGREQEGNRIIYRTHWVSLFQRGKFPFVFLFISIFAVINWWLRGFPFGLLPDTFWLAWPVLIATFGGWTWWVFEDWRNDLYIVTADRIIDLQRTPLLLRETRKEATLDKIQTLETNIPSALARFLRYGTVIIRVPGSAFEFKNVHDPGSIQTEINRKMEQFKRNQAQAAERGRRTELMDWFAVYDQIRQGHKPPGILSNSGERQNDGSP